MGEEDKKFMIDPSSFDDDSGRLIHMPPNADAAWMLQLIQIRLNEAPIEEKFKRELLLYMAPYLNLAGMTNITRGQVIEFFVGYDKLWTKYRIFMNRDKFDANLIFLKDWIKEMFVMMLNKSIEGWQGDRVFERRHVYDIKQKREQTSDKLKKFFGKKTPPEGVVEK